ncbi:MAG: lysophospholipid acyltransferase family protein [Candidatus Zhuqueibacterota bacterium]
MRRILRLIGFIFVNFLFLVLAVLLAPVTLFFGRRAHRKLAIKITKVWAQWMVVILGFTVKLRNEHLIDENQHYFIVGNHLSYLDIILVGCKKPGLFVAKKEVRSWPLLGQLAWLGGTIFVDRSKRGKEDRPYIGQIAKYLRQGLTILVFPEGTSTEGDTVLPFKKTIFSSPILAETPILPLTVKYVSVNHQPFGPGNRDLVCWYADMTFVDHFWNMLNLKEFTVEIIANPPVVEKPVDENVLPQARELSETVYNAVLETYKQGKNEATYA